MFEISLRGQLRQWYAHFILNCCLILLKSESCLAQDFLLVAAVLAEEAAVCYEQIYGLQSGEKKQHKPCHSAQKFQSLNGSSLLLGLC